MPRLVNTQEVNMPLEPYLTLVADDSDDDQMLIRHFLRAAPNVRVVGCVQDGNETLSYLRGAGRFGDRRKFPYPDLLLLDFQMPRLNGIEVLTLLETDGIRPRIILWSNALELVDEKLARSLGADVVCEKPTGGLEMLTIIRRLEWPELMATPLATPALPAQRLSV